MKQYGSRLKRSRSTPTSARRSPTRRRVESNPSSLRYASSTRPAEAPVVPVNPFGCAATDPYGGMGNDGCGDPYGDAGVAVGSDEKREGGADEVSARMGGSDWVSKRARLVESATHEERAKLDELDYVLDGLKPSQARAVQRASALQLARLFWDGGLGLLLRGYTGFGRVFACLFACAESDAVVSLACGVIGVAVAEDEKNSAHLGLSYLECIGRLMQMRTFVAEETKRAEGATPQPRKRRRRSRTPSKSLSSSADRDALFSMLGAKTETERTRATPELLASRSLAKSSANTSLKRSLLLDFDAIAKHVVRSLADAAAALQSRLRTPRRKRGLKDSGSTTGAPDAPLEALPLQLQIVENLSHEDESEPIFIATIGLDGLAQLVKALDAILRAYLSPGQSSRMPSRRDLALGALRVLVNLTNNQESGCDAARAAIRSVYELVEIHCAKGDSFSFDAATLGLGVLINCCELSTGCCDQLRACDGAIRFVAMLFKDHSSQQGPDANELESKALASYSAMLLGFLARGSPRDEAAVRDAVGAPGFTPLVRMIEEFIVLQCRANMMTQESLQSLVTVVDALKKAQSKHDRQ